MMVCESKFFSWVKVWNLSLTTRGTRDCTCFTILIGLFRLIRSVNHEKGSIGGRLATSQLLVSASYLAIRGPCNVSDWLNENITTNQRLPHQYEKFRLEEANHFTDEKMAICSSLSLVIRLDLPRS